jgi:hypothetical protein
MISNEVRKGALTTRLVGRAFASMLTTMAIAYHWMPGRSAIESLESLTAVDDRIAIVKSACHQNYRGAVEVYLAMLSCANRSWATATRLFKV